jgi:phosphoribosyl 1,2-cyclic phosphodiesterase
MSREPSRKRKGANSRAGAAHLTILAAMRLAICGSRGSTPAPGPEFVRYGGHTSCVALARPGEPPHLVIDAGTGIRRVTALLDGASFSGTILLSHLHWDHTTGLPFFTAADNPAAHASLYLPEQGPPEKVLARAMSPPHFPIRPSEMRGTWHFAGLDPGAHTFEGYSVLARDVPHKGGRNYGFRISDGYSTITYISDHSPVAFGPGPDGLGTYHDAVVELAAGADILMHDSQHTAEEFPSRADFGHAAIEYAVGLAERCGVKRLLLFHHDPARTDEQLDAIVARQADSTVQVEAAAEGSVFELDPVDGSVG